MMSLKFNKTHPRPHFLHFHPLQAIKVRLIRIKHLFTWKNLHNEKVGELIHEKELIAEGLFVAIILHTLYNFFLSIDLAWVSVLIIAFEFLVILHEFEMHRNNVVIRNK